MRTLMVIALVIIGSATPAHASSDFPEGLEWLEEYRGRTLPLRASVNANPFTYLRIVEDFATLEMRGDFLPLMAGESVTVKKVKLALKQGMVTFEVENEFGEDGRFNFIAPVASGETMGQRHVDDLLALVCSDSDVLPYIVNETSRTLHYKGSNHSGDFESGREYGRHSDAVADGHRLCPACFLPIHLLPDYDKEMTIGRMVASEVRSDYPAVLSDSLQAYVRNVGRRVLANWPLPLRGYEYRFTVVEATLPDAIACPGGWIFVHQGLLDLCESEEELESVLAHEIAHVEMRHGLRQLHTAEKAARIGTIAGLVIGGVAASQDSDMAMMVGGLAVLISNTATEIALAGYSREMVREADAVAVNYLIHNRGTAERHHLASVLAKMEYLGECETGHHRRSNDLLSRPYDNIRSDFATNAEVVFFPEPLLFELELDKAEHLQVGIHGVCHHTYFLQERYITYEDQQAYEFGVAGQTKPDYGAGKYLSETRVFATVEAGRGIERDTEFKDMKLLLDGDWVEFDNKEDTKLYPNTTTSMVLSRRQNGHLAFESLVPESLRFSGRKGGRSSSGDGLR